VAIGGARGGDGGMKFGDFEILRKMSFLLNIKETVLLQLTDEDIENII
jgi:hypothetical protein